MGSEPLGKGLSQHWKPGLSCSMYACKKHQLRADLLTWLENNQLGW